MNYKWYRKRFKPVVVKDEKELVKKRDEQWMSVSEAAEALGVHRNTIRNWYLLVNYFDRYGILSGSLSQKIERIPVKDCAIVKKKGQKRGKIFVKVTFS